jgi:hypothetical protein
MKSHTMDEEMKNFMLQLLHTFLKQLGQGASKSSLLREVSSSLFSCDNELQEIAWWLH